MVMLMMLAAMSGNDEISMMGRATGEAASPEPAGPSRFRTRPMRHVHAASGRDQGETSHADQP